MLLNKKYVEFTKFTINNVENKLIFYCDFVCEDYNTIEHNVAVDR